MTVSQSKVVAEDWRPVLGWEGFHEVSSLGRVRSVERFYVHVGKGLASALKHKSRKVLAQAIGTHGYPRVVLTRPGAVKRTVDVHILVCEAFHGPRPSRFDAAHNDGNRLNACADNLRWASRRENKADELRHGTRNHGERNGGSYLTDEQARTILASAEVSTARIAAEFEVPIQSVRRLRRGSTYRHLERYS